MKKKIILASSSPRRIEMMKKNGFNPQIIPAYVVEQLPINMSPEAAVMYLALKKAAYIDAATNGSHLIIAADTVVVHDNIILGKPESKEHAYEMLSKMKNDHHNVMTGVCIIDTYSYTKQCFFDKTSVYFRNYSDRELNAYINTDEPYDKAGGYAIQGTFSKYIDHIEGDYNNVVGFPWYRIKPFL
ncbi:MAG: Maf family protein [Bacillota bacterium]|nr:Maf family protein [Bacillota bacterium]